MKQQTSISTDEDTRFLQSNGLRMAYQSFGRSSDPVILLVAGLYNQMVRWPLAFCHRLVDRGFRVIRFDNRDIGLTDKMDAVQGPGLLRLFLKYYFSVPVKAPYSLNDMAADTLGILDALGIQQAHLVGMSMGGMISQLVTALYPERILSLTSIMSSSGERGKGAAGLKVMRQMVRPASKTRTALDNAVETWQMLDSPAYPRSEEEIRQLLRAEDQRASNPAGYRRQIAAIYTAPSRVKLLRTIKVPTLIIHGQQDPLVCVSGGIDTARHIAHARLELFEGMGHTLPEPLLPTFVDLIVANTHKTAQPLKA